MVEKDEIFMAQGTDYKQMTLDLLTACDLAGDIFRQVKDRMGPDADPRQVRIGLKPNLNVAKPADQGATTHPELVDGALTYLQQQGFENLVVLEGSWVGDSTARAVRINGIWDVCQEHSVPFFDTQKDKSVSCEVKGMQLTVCQKALDLDYRINLPVVKGHCQTTITCALKNWKGLIPNSEKRRYHTLGLHKPIAHLNTVIPQDFILADNICGDLDFEEGGNPVTMNRILAFRDPVLCDSFAAEVLGYHPWDIEYIRLAEELGVGSSQVANARVYDLRADEKEQAASLEEVFGSAPHARGRTARLAAYVDAKDACSACYGSLIYALDRLQDEGLLEGKEKRSIAIGQGYKKKAGQTDPAGRIGIGNCTKCLERSLGGCPPRAVDIAEFLKKEWQ